jgi:hypothetical protein
MNAQLHITCLLSAEMVFNIHFWHSNAPKTGEKDAKE